jgi:hypothetical protein
VLQSLGCRRAFLWVYFKQMRNKVNEALIPHWQTVPQGCLLRYQVLQPASILKIRENIKYEHKPNISYPDLKFDILIVIFEL